MQSDARPRNVEPLAADETDRLISSEKVDGTAVYASEGERLGEIHHVMIDKYTGQADYAVMSFGGILGIGESYHPLPWRMLTYDTGIGGYVVDLRARQLEAAPRYTMNSQPDWSDPDYRDRIDEYWMVPGV